MTISQYTAGFNRRSLKRVLRDLVKYDIQGTKRDHFDCPITNLIEQECQDKGLDLTYIEVTRSNVYYEEGCSGFRHKRHMGGGANDFVEAFDNGNYPQFEDNYS